MEKVIAQPALDANWVEIRRRAGIQMRQHNEFFRGNSVATPGAMDMAARRTAWPDVPLVGPWEPGAIIHAWKVYVIKIRCRSTEMRSRVGFRYSNLHAAWSS